MITSILTEPTTSKEVYYYAVVLQTVEVDEEGVPCETEELWLAFNKKVTEDEIRGHLQGWLNPLTGYQLVHYSFVPSSAISAVALAPRDLANEAELPF